MGKHDTKYPTVTKVLTVGCPACLVPAGEKCTHPTENGRRKVSWVHLSRKDAYLETLK